MKLIINVVVFIVVPLFIISGLCALMSYLIFTAIEKKYGRDYVNKLWVVRFGNMMF